MHRIRVMFNPLALEEDVELPFGLCTVEVEDTGYHISCTGLESPPTEDMFCMSLCESMAQFLLIHKLKQTQRSA